MSWKYNSNQATLSQEIYLEKKKKETPLLSVAIIKTVDVEDNVIAAVTNDLRSRLEVRVCTVSTFYSEPQHLSTARRFLH